MSDILSALNTNGSGLNISGLAKDLASAEVTPRKKILQDKINDMDVSVSALGEARSMMKDLLSSLTVITRDPLLQTTSSSSGISASISDPSKVVAGTESVNVVALAKEQVLEFKGFTSETAVVQGGTITVDFGVWTAEEPPVFYAGERPGFDMLVPEGATLQDLAEQFDNISGVQASIIDIGDGTFTLGILSATGGQNGMRFTVNATGAAADIALTDMDTTATIETHQIRGASDAVLEYNGITVFRPSNSVDDLIDGVELELKDVTGAAATLTTAVDADDALARVQVLVAKVNETLEFLDEQTKRGVIEGGEPGALAGETSIEGIKNSIRSFLRTSIEGFGDKSLHLSDFGVSMQRNGMLKLDEDVFDKVMAEDPMKLAALFENQVSASNGTVTVAGRPPFGTNTGTYAFSRDPVTGIAHLGTTELTSLFPGVGVTFYLAASGPMSGVSVTVPDGLDSFDVSFGRNFTDMLMERINTALNSDNALSSREAELQRNMASNEEEIAELDEKLISLEARYNKKFTAMEQMVTQLNGTGQYITNLINAWAAEAK